MKKYNYSPEERETIIIWNEAHDIISISTWDKDFGAKLANFAVLAPDLFIDPIRCTPDGLTECKIGYGCLICTLKQPISDAKLNAILKNGQNTRFKKGTENELREN